jgi:hypothetical protein
VVVLKRRLLLANLGVTVAHGVAMRERGYYNRWNSLKVKLGSMAAGTDDSITEFLWLLLKIPPSGFP